MAVTGWIQRIARRFVERTTCGSTTTRKKPSNWVYLKDLDLEMKTLMTVALLIALSPLLQIPTATPPKTVSEATRPVVRQIAAPVVTVTSTTTTLVTVVVAQTDPFWVRDTVALVTFPEPVGNTLGYFVDEYFLPEDRSWALRVAFCESSARPGDTTSTAHHSSSGASGWFQHLPKFWVERSSKAGVAGSGIMEPEVNVLVAAWLLYETPQGKGHWNESKYCWG